MAVVRHPSLRRFLQALIWLAIVIVVGLVFPPFHVHRLGSTAGLSSGNSARLPAALDVRKYAEDFWKDRLAPAGSQATEAGIVAAALASDPELAASKYGRRSGLGGNALYFIRGTGRVRSVDRKGVWLALEGQDQNPVLLPIGPLFGNALRDATGLLNVQDFSSFDFNALSTELNRIAETRIQPDLKRAVVGKQLRFVGCAEATDESGKLQLKVVPISIEYPS
jgi:predicted lipoprotein